ncbi:MAG: DegT/DnrJ/EryC1/StrS aminotransferase family protein [Bacteroidales bacterium]
MIPFSPPRIDDKIIKEVTDTLRSGWITTGPKTKLFEKKLAEFAHVPKVICVNAGTTGLELMLRWFGVGPGDEVIIPAYTYCATANVIMHCGAKAVMVDSNTGNFNINPEKIKSAITSRTKAIIPVDIGGYPADYDEIHNIICDPDIRALFSPKTDAQQKLGRIMLLSDAAHSLGGLYKGKPVGSLADVSVFSFHAVKNLTTSEGGAIALNLPEGFDHDAIYNYLNIMSLHGQSKDALAKSQIGNWRYDVLMAGYKANMTDIQASIGLVELERYKTDTLPRRKNIIDAYNKAFEQENWAEIPPVYNNNTTSSFHLYQLRIKNINEATRDRIIEDIFKKEVSVNVHFQPLPMLTHYKNSGYEMQDYPNAFKNYEREISLPVYYDLSDENVNTVIKTVIDAVNKILA